MNGWGTPSASQTTSTRSAPRSHQPWVPLPYMVRGVEHLVHHRSAGLPLRPGGRKTSITLAAFETLRQLRLAQTMLVIAPLRVCRQTWRQEAEKWDQFRHLKFSLLHGGKKRDRLSDDADIWLINPEGVPWLCDQFFGRPLPWDVVTIDELTKFKNNDSERSKKLRPRIAITPYIWGLTGSLSPNGYMDLFGQQLMLDRGAALGKFITHYRDQYFQLDRDGFTYNLMPGADKRIQAKLAPYWLAVDESDYSQLPPLVDNPIYIELGKKERAIYTAMKTKMIAELPGGMVTAGNSAAVYAKLSQMANGAVYRVEEVPGEKSKRYVEYVHDMKLDALEDLIEELNGEPLLIGYEFGHDLDRLRSRFGQRFPNGVLPYLGNGTTAKQETEWCQAWNAGKLPIMAIHPASAGHGLNLQESSAWNIAWFGITWDYELYDQLIRRIRRDGTKAQQIFNHLLIVRNSIDELKLAALAAKKMSQDNLLQGMNRILRDADARMAPGSRQSQETKDMPKLSRQPTADAPPPQTQTGGWTQIGQAQPAAEQPRAAVAPPGWGGPADGQADTSAQRERIKEQVTGEVQPPIDGRSAFSAGVRQQMETVGQDVRHTAEVAHSSGVPFEGAKDVQQADPAVNKTPRTRKAKDPTGGVPPEVKLGLLQIAFSDPETTVEDGLEIARQLLEFVSE